MKVHLQLAGTPGSLRSTIRDLEATGADGVFTFEGRHDVFAPLVLAAADTELELMTNVAIALPRNAIHLANIAHDLQAMSGGRFQLGLGSQVRTHIEKRYGVTWDRPAKQMGETVAAVKAILDSWQNGTRLDYRGEYRRHTLMPPTFNPGPLEHGQPPILLGALGPVMTRTAAEIADGILVMPFNSARHFEQRTLPAIRHGWQRAGRGAGDFSIVVQAMVAVARTDAQLRAAMDGVAQMIAFYASTPAYRPVLQVEGWEHVHPELNELSKRGAFDQMRSLITDEMVRTIAVAGTPESCAQEIVARFGAHAAQVCCYFPGYEPDPQHVADLIRALQNEERNNHAGN